jgi:hypothetical protein
MLTPYTIKDLYALALAEGEGMGTAYEYYAKRLALEPWLKRRPKPGTMLIAGLPQRYGLSLDFLLLASELGAAVTVIDERPESFERLFAARESLLQDGLFQLVEPTTVLARDLAQLNEVTETFDLVVSSEVLQRLIPAARPQYAAKMGDHGAAVALFAPNADNSAHTNRSGLAGLHLDELRLLVPEASASGYIDMPPFPPGITRSDEQREQATTGAFENVVMWGLGHYARREHWVPNGTRRTQSHIVYALTPD